MSEFMDDRQLAALRHRARRHRHPRPVHRLLDRFHHGLLLGAGLHLVALGVTAALSGGILLLLGPVALMVFPPLLAPSLLLLLFFLGTRRYEALWGLLTTQALTVLTGVAWVALLQGGLMLPL